MAAPSGITSPPTPPSRSNPATFNDDAEAFVAWMENFVNVEWGNLDPAIFFAVQTDEDDATDGLLMKNGAHGLGGRSRDSADWDATTVTGFYRSTDTANPGLPTADTGWNVIHIEQTAARAVQSAIRASDSRSFVRHRSAALTWEPWVEIYHQGSVLGTVSHSGGVVTGALIERGSNANGGYRLFADGTLECWIIDAAVDVTSTSAQTFDWPVSFLSDTAVASFQARSGAPNSALEYSNIRALRATASSAQIRLSSAGTSSDPASDDERIDISAKGEAFTL